MKPDGAIPHRAFLVRLGRGVWWTGAGVREGEEWRVPCVWESGGRGCGGARWKEVEARTAFP